MIAVRLRQGGKYRFHAGELVWATGTLRFLPGDATGSTPLYVLEQARVEPAGRSDVARFFR